MQPLIRVDGLAHTYAVPGRPPLHALRGIDLTIDAGEYVAITGANGSGKTTLARHLNALLLPTRGDVWVAGRNTQDRSAVRDIRADVAMVFQSPMDQIVATVVREDVAFGPENLGVPEAQLANVVRLALERVDMWSARHRAPHMLSAGQQQRVAIAGALAMRPRCLVLDEATAMLDPLARRQLLDILDDLHSAGITVITITHAMSEAARAQRVVVIHAGRVALDGSPRAVFAAEDLPSLGLSLPPVPALARRLAARLAGFPADAQTVAGLASAVLEWHRDSTDHRGQ